MYRSWRHAAAGVRVGDGARLIGRSCAPHPSPLPRCRCVAAMRGAARRPPPNRAIEGGDERREIRFCLSLTSHCSLAPAAASLSVASLRVASLRFGAASPLKCVALCLPFVSSRFVSQSTREATRRSGRRRITGSDRMGRNGMGRDGMGRDGWRAERINLLIDRRATAPSNEIWAARGGATRSLDDPPADCRSILQCRAIIAN